jgi:AcrR family transcriptional regulator
VSPTATVSPTTRDRLLAAAEACLRRDGIRRTTMTEIADEAKVSRAALYKHFPDKASLVVSALARTDERFWSAATARVSAADGIGNQIVAAVRFALEHQPGALLLRLKSQEPEAYAATVGIGLRAMVPGMAGFWRPYIQAARERGDVRADLDVDDAAEWIMRVVLSLVTIPGDRERSDVARARRFVDNFVVASLR